MVGSNGIARSDPYRSAVPMGQVELNGVGVKGLVRHAARRARTRPLDAHGMTQASVSGGRGALSPAPRALGGKSGESRGAKPLWARAEGPLQVKKLLPNGQALLMPRRGVWGCQAKRGGAKPQEVLIWGQIRTKKGHSYPPRKHWGCFSDRVRGSIRIRKSVYQKNSCF